jgi:hypothetical protein
MEGKVESLHNHTTTSDGLMNYKELFELAQRTGFSSFAFTDHDALPGDKELSYLHQVKDDPMKWVIGIEMTVAYPEEYGGAYAGSAHLIGLFVDPTNDGLLEHCRLAQEARVVRMKTMTHSLRQLGFTITEEDCLRFSGGDSVGRPHIVSALRLYPENFRVEQGLIEEMRIESMHNPQLRDKYEKMIARGPESYPYQLYLAYEAYRPAYAEVSYLPSLGDAAQMIRNAGGISGIAHYYTTKRHLSLEAISWLLENDVIDGMEVVYGSYYSGEQGNDLHAERKLLANVVNKQQKISMGGGDIHNIDDLQTYFTHREVANDSVGLTHKILSSGKVDTRWSSY